MKNLGIFVGENGKWSFFHEIFADLNKYFDTQVFKPRTYNVPILHGRLNQWAYIHDIRQIVETSDLCFFEWASELLEEATKLPKRSPFVTRLHSYEITFWASKINWEPVDKVILLSEAMREKFVTQLPDHAHKTVVVSNAVSLDKFVPPTKREFGFDIAMLCNIHPVKRVYDMIMNIYALIEQGYKPHLHVAGPRWPDGYFDDYYVAIFRLIEKLKLEGHVTMYGNVEDAAQWLQDKDIFVSHSYWEGQQTALIEAMATGCYCLAHFWDGAEEMLPPENLYITDGQLQEKLVGYWNWDTTKKQMEHERMRNLAVEKFDARVMIRKIRNVIEEVI